MALEQLHSWPAPAAGGVVRVGAAGPTVTERVDDGVTRPWASVSKLLVTLAALVAVEEGVLDLDQPAGPPGATVRHLLAHASGLGPEAGPPLTGVGRRRIYSNAGIEIVADTLAAAAGMPFERYLAEGVFGPLAMAGTALAPGGSPAWAAAGPVGDLLALAAELLAPTLVDPSTLAMATAVAFPGLAGVVPGVGRFDPCDWGLGFELRDGKDPHWTGRANAPATFGHFGQSGAFVWVDPVAGVACAVTSDEPFGPWALQAWPRLADAVVADAG